MYEFLIIFSATLFYNILNGLASIFIAKGLITRGAFFDALRNVINILILSIVILEVKGNYYLLIPLFFGYFIGMIISGLIVNYLKIGEVTITAFVNGDKNLARTFAEVLSEHNIMNTSFIGTGSKSKTIAIVIISKRKKEEKVVKHIRELAKSFDLNVKITISETAEWRK